MSRLNPLRSWRYANPSLPVVTDWCLFSCIVRVVWEIHVQFRKNLHTSVAASSGQTSPSAAGAPFQFKCRAQSALYGEKVHTALVIVISEPSDLVTQRRLTAYFDNNRPVVWETDRFLYRVKCRSNWALSAWTLHGRISLTNQWKYFTVVQKLSVPRMHENVQKTNLVSIYSVLLYRLRVLPVVLVE